MVTVLGILFITWKTNLHLLTEVFVQLRIQGKILCSNLFEIKNLFSARNCANNSVNECMLCLCYANLKRLHKVELQMKEPNRGKYHVPIKPHDNKNL
jgi:hypothetical protein